MSANGIHDCGQGRFNLKGRLDFYSVPPILEQGKRYISTHDKICFDLASVEHADSAGVSLLVNLLRYAQHNMKQIKFINIPAQVVDIIRVSGLTEILSTTKV